MKAPARYIGLTISETQIRQHYRINILTLIKMEEQVNIFGFRSKVKKVSGVVAPETRIEEGDILLLFGHVKDIGALLSVEDT